MTVLMVDRRVTPRARRLGVSNGMDAPSADAIDVPEWRCQPPLDAEGASTMQIPTIGSDLAKNVFQVHGANEHGKPVLRKQLKHN